MNVNLSKSVYDKVLLNYLSDENILRIHENIKQGKLPLNNIEDIGLSEEEITQIQSLLYSLTQETEEYVSLLSHGKISITLSSIFKKILKDGENGEWKFLFKEDVIFICKNASENYKKYFNTDAVYNLDDYSCNAWNTAVCLRALLKWFSRFEIYIEEKTELFEIIKKSLIKLQKYIDNKVINKFPEGVNSAYNLTDYCFVSLLSIKINNVISRSPTTLNPLTINKNEIINTLISTQNEDGGWSDLVYSKDQNYFEILGPSNFIATCYAMLLLKDTFFQDKERLVDKAMREATAFILQKIDQRNSWKEKNGKPDLEATCLAYQVLNRPGAAYDNHKRIAGYLRSIAKRNARYLALNEKNKIVAHLYLENDDKLVRMISLLVITLLKAKTKIKSTHISFSLAWLIKIALTESKSNLIHILCAVSDYLEAERNYLLYGEEAIEKEVDFIV